MRLLAITEDANGSSTRYRVLQYLPALRAADIETEVVVWPDDRRERNQLLERVREADVVLLQRRLLGPWNGVRLCSRSHRLVFDFDDALPFRDSRRGASKSIDRVAKFRAFVSRVDLVLAGNAYLAELAAPFAPRVVVLPTAVPTDRFRPRAPADPGTLGWIGSRSTLLYLEDLLPALDELAVRAPGSGSDFRLRVVADAFPEPLGLPVECVRWRKSDEPSEIAQFGIGLAPLRDDAWTRGKCGLRVLLYFAAGIPVVASPVGVQAELVSDGVTGLLAATPSAFVDAVRRLHRDAGLRRACASAGRALVEERFSVERIAPVLMKAIQSLA